jgi:ketosteroid isomerase-like protein
VSEEDVALARRSIELSIAGDINAGRALWSEDIIGIPPRDWPEPGPFRGRDELVRVFDTWSVAFGENWPTHMRISDAHELRDHRVLIELEFETSGVESGIPIDQELALIYTVGDGEIVKAEYFMSVAEARQAAGIE